MEILSRSTTFFLRSLTRLALGLALAVASVSPFLLRAASPATAPVNMSEYQVKAAYLLKFARYVDWPADSFSSADAPLVIGVLGTNPFDDHLDRAVTGLKIKDRPVEVRYLKTPEEGAPCHVVFIARRQEREEAAWLRTLQGRPVLTVTESDRGLERGAVLSFLLEESAGGTKVRFTASMPAAQQAGLKLSASMLASAKNVIRLPEEPKAMP
jgi:YfiR/HmsC-like